MTLERSCEKRDLGVPRLIGRETEKRHLNAALDRTLRFSAPQFVTVVGNAGMGKSRLLTDWLGEVDKRRDFRTVYLSAMGGNLIGRLLRTRLGLGDDLDEDTARALFRDEVQAVFGDRRVNEMASLLGAFLGLAPSGTPLVQSLAMRPDQQLQLSRAVLARFLEEDARQTPRLYVIDDLQEADEESLDLLSRLRCDLGETTLVIVALARPDFLVRRPSWFRAEGSHVRVDVGPLSALEMDVFIQCALATATLAPGLVEHAAVESRGNPSSLIDLLERYRESGVLTSESATTWRFDRDRVPEKGHARLPELEAAARVSSLGAAERELLARAAGMGSVFWTGGVVALARLGTDPWDPTLVFAPDPSIAETRRMLESLVARGFIENTDAFLASDETAWRFVNDDERMLLATAVDPEANRRRKRFAAQWIEARAHKPMTAEQLEAIAVLYAEGDDGRRASQHFIAAGDDACRLRDLERARSLYTRGLELLDSDDSLLRIETLHKVGDVCARLGRSHEALAFFGDMLNVAWRLDLPGKGGAAHARIGRIYRTLGDYRMAVQHLDMAHLLFDLGRDRPGVAASLDDIGRVYYLVGKPEEALRCHKAALGIRVELADERGKALTLGWIGLVEGQIGHLGQAQKAFERALAISQASRDTHGIVFGLLDLGALTRDAGHAKLAHKLLCQARRVAEELCDRLTDCHLALQIGDCLLALGNTQEAEQEILDAQQIAQKFGARRLLAEAARGLAETALARADFSAARDHADTAASEAEKMGAGPLLGTALRVLATALAGGATEHGSRGGPREVFDRAVELLCSSGAELELGRTFLAYADFEESLGRQEAAERLRDRAFSIRREAGLPEGEPRFAVAEAVLQ